MGNANTKKDLAKSFGWENSSDAFIQHYKKFVVYFSKHSKKFGQAPKIKVATQRVLAYPALQMLPITPSIDHPLEACHWLLLPL